MNLDLSSLPMPIRLRPETPMSDEELMCFSRVNRPFRMEREPNGEILIMTPAGTNVAFINLRIARALGNWADEDGRGVVFATDTGFTLPSGAVRAPDACWMSRQRWNAMTKSEQDGFGSRCPEFIVELASPSDRVQDLERKMVEDWIASGAELAWLFEPKTRRVTIYRPGREAEVLEDPSSVQGTGCVAGFELVMERCGGEAELKEFLLRMAVEDGNADPLRG